MRAHSQWGPREALQEALWKDLREASPERQLVLVALLNYCQRFYCFTRESDPMKDFNVMWRDIIGRVSQRMLENLRATWRADMDGALKQVVYPWLDCMFRFVGPPADGRDTAEFRMLPTIDPWVDPQTMKRNRQVHSEFLFHRIEGRDPGDVRKYENLSPVIGGDSDLRDTLDPWKAAVDDPQRVPAEVQDFIQKAGGWA